LNKQLAPPLNVDELANELITHTQVLAEKLVITFDYDDEDEQKNSSFAFEGNNTPS
jgi:hypothetical protein